MIITEKISIMTVNTLTKNNLLNNKEKESYIYCIDFTLDLILFNLILIIFGFFTHKIILTLLYIIILVPTKMLAGGAHAKSASSCSILSFIIYFIVLFFCSVIFVSRTLYVLIISLTAIGICVLAPVKHENKTYTIKKVKKIKALCLKIVMLIYISAIIMLSFNLHTYCNLIMLCFCIIFINQIIGLLINKRRTVNETKYCNM